MATVIDHDHVIDLIMATVVDHSHGYRSQPWSLTTAMVIDHSHEVIDYNYMEVRTVA